MPNFSIPDIIKLGDISVPLSANYEYDGEVMGKRLATTSPLTIAIVTDALRWHYEGFPPTSITDAVGSITITNVGNDGDKIEVFVNDVELGIISLGSYIKQTSDTTTDGLAANVTAALTNLNGYGVSVLNSTITITVRTGLGASMNGDNRLQAVISTPSISASSLSPFPNTVIGNFSTSQMTRVSGILLFGYPGNITITSPNTNFQVSNDNSTWGSSTTIPFTSDTISNVPVYVRFSPQSAGNLSGNLSITGGGLTTPALLPISGVGVAAASLTATPLNPFPNTLLSTNSASQYFELTGLDLTGFPGLVTITAPSTDFQVSTNNTNWFSSVTVPYTTSSLASTNIYVRFTPQSTGTKSGNISISGGGASTTVAVTGISVVEMLIGAVGLTYLKFSNITAGATYYINWGDGNTDTYTSGTSSPTHTYSSAFTGNVKLQVIAYADITKLEIANTPDEPKPSSNTNFPVIIQGSEITKLTALTSFVTRSSAKTSSITTSQLPRTISTLRFDYTEISGSIGNLPPALTSCLIYSLNTVSGTLASLFTQCPSLTIFEVTGNNTISGTINSLNTNMVSFVVTGSNTIGGNLNTLPTLNSIVAFSVGGNNYITGDLSDFDFSNTNLLTFSIGGNTNHYQPTSNITGDVSSITFNTVLKTFKVFNGLNTITGDVDLFPKSLTSLVVGGESTVYTTSGNTLFGYVDTFPPDLIELSVTGKCTIQGDIADYIPSSLVFYTLGGLNTLSGDLYDAPPNVRLLNIRGQNTISTYSATRSWGGTGTVMYYLAVVSSSSSLTTQSEVNQLFVDLDGSTWESYPGISSKLISYTGLTPTGAGLTAKNNLVNNKGVTVTIL